MRILRAAVPVVKIEESIKFKEKVKAMTQLTEEQIQNELKKLQNWELKGDKIQKEFTFGTFREALAFIVRLGFEAEGHGHHPEITNVYNSVTLRLSTHDAGDRVTSKDIDLAGAIDKIGK